MYGTSDRAFQTGEHMLSQQVLLGKVVRGPQIEVSEQAGWTTG